MGETYQRELLRGSLDLMLLSSLALGAKYGYLIQKDVRQASGGRIPLPAGTLYPLLHRLESEKLIRSRWDDAEGRRRKWYELTAAGQKRLQRQADQWHSYVECIRQLLEAAQVGSPKPA